MEKLFIETTEFSARVAAFLSDDDYRELQTLLLANPDIGKVMPGCGGMRKVRLADPRRGKGKRGGIRVIYLHVPESNVIFFAKLYGKDAQENLDASDKKLLKMVAEEFKREAKEKDPSRGTLI
jgi:hypothetical protein